MPDYRPIAKEISCYGLPYGLFGVGSWFFALICTMRTFAKPSKKRSLLRSAIKLVMTLGPVISSCFTCNGNWVFILMALGKFGPEALKQLKTRIVISKSDPDKNEKANKRLTGTMRWFAAFTTISLCLAGWAALVTFVVMLPSDDHDPKWTVWMSVIISAIIFILVLFCISMCVERCLKAMGLNEDVCSIAVAYAIAASHVVFSHIILADLYKNWYGIPPDVYQKVTAIIFAIGINIEFFEILESWYDNITSQSDS